MNDLTTADLAFRDVLDGHLNIRTSGTANGEDDLDDEAAAFLRGDVAPALALQAKHDAKIKARSLATPEERVKAMNQAGESVMEIAKAVGWSRRATQNHLAGIKPRVAIDAQAANRLRKSGAKLKDIAAALGVSMGHLSGLCDTQKKRKPIPKDRILSLKALGWSFRAIQKECGVGTVTIQKLVNELDAIPAIEKPVAKCA